LLNIFHYRGENKGQHIPIITEYDTKGNIIKQYGERILLLEKDGYGRPYYSFHGFSKMHDGTIVVRYSFPYLTVSEFQSYRSIKK